MDTIKAKIGYCSKYGTLWNFLCRKSPNNNDDWDELEDPCSNCGWWQHTEIEMNPFKVKVKKPRYKGAAEKEIVEAYVKYDMLVVEGRIISVNEFKEHYEQ